MTAALGGVVAVAAGQVGGQPGPPDENEWIPILVAVLGASAALWAADALGRAGRLRRRIIAHQDVIAALAPGRSDRELLALHVDHEMLQLLVTLHPRGRFAEGLRWMAFLVIGAGVCLVVEALLLVGLGLWAEQKAMDQAVSGMGWVVLGALLIVVTDRLSWLFRLLVAQALRRRAVDLRRASDSFLTSALGPQRWRAWAVRTLPGTRRSGAKPRPGRPPS